MRGIFVSIAVLTACLAAACGSPPAATTPEADPAAPAASASAAPPSDGAAKPESAKSPAAWKDAKTKEEKMAFMSEHVSPTMGKVFQGADAKRYASFDCKTCHGPKYQEPDEFLPKLTMKDGKLTSFADKPEVSKFMAEKVVPEMAKLMGEQPYDPATKQGFGCAGCHAIEMK